MVVLGPSLFGRGVRTCAGLAGNVGFGRERAGFEGFFLSGVSVCGQLLNRWTGESWCAWRHAGADVLTVDAVVSDIRGGGEGRQRRGSKYHGGCEHNFVVGATQSVST